MSGALARAPGRVNLIGEHTDYNGGFVLPCAIASGTSAHFRTSATRSLAVRTQLGQAAFPLDDLPPERYGDWRDYARGILFELQAAGARIAGGSVDVESTVPIGAGLSSSASFEIALALALTGTQPADTGKRIELAKLAQRAENVYTGTKSGIMDQFAVLFGRAGHAMLLDTRSLSWEAVPVPAHLAVVIANSMERHELSGGEYNVRRAECERAAATLAKHAPHVRELRDVSPDDLPLAQEVLSEVLYRRVKHVVSENARVVETAQALRADDPPAAGEAMNASHESLRSDYEVSTGSLDALAQAARECGAYGSRMTGGGFGGCTVSLVERESAPAFARALARLFHERTGVHPELYDGTPSQGAWVRDDV